jgi:hypothetical protein
MSRIILVHTPVHASWLNQVETYFSIIQRKVLTPNDFATLDAVSLRLALYEQLSNRTPRPCGRQVEGFANELARCLGVIIRQHPLSQFLEIHDHRSTSCAKAV